MARGCTTVVLDHQATKVVTVVGGACGQLVEYKADYLQILYRAARPASSLSLKVVFAHSLCSPRRQYNLAERTDGLGHRSVPRSRFKWSCCATAIFMICPGAGFRFPRERERPSPIVDLDLIDPESAIKEN